MWKLDVKDTQEIRKKDVQDTQEIRKKDVKDTQEIRRKEASIRELASESLEMFSR